jgi:protein TonB
MPNERLLRFILVGVVAAIHLFLIFFVVFTMNTVTQEELENARIMKVTDLAEAPPPPPPEEEEIPQVEAIAENLIETDTVPVQAIVAHGSVTSSATSWDDYLPIHKVSEAPKFDEKDIMSNLVYPPIALRSGIEGRVILELFVDKNGTVQRISIMLEDPKDRGFGEAAIKAFSGKRGFPAMANGAPVSARYRYPVRFQIK